MNQQQSFIVAILAACVVVFSGSAILFHESSSEQVGDRDVMTQVSILQGLMVGDYYGSMTVGELLRHGDIGLGTFDALDGEMIVLNGVCYQATGDGSVRVADKGTTVPFACVTHLDREFLFDLESVTSMEDLKTRMDAQIAKHSSNYMYVATLKVTFDTLQVRSELSQNEPYKPLTEVLEHDERRFDHSDVTGTVVAVYCPAYMSTVNSAGWHFHFLSDDLKVGGHVLQLSFQKASVVLDRTESLDIRLPDGEFFRNADLKVSQKDIEDVEG
ncbi:MAG: acetolactate decarboxylase [archaeon]|nr:acetolactate decarboxylase [archaeon]